MGLPCPNLHLLPLDHLSTTHFVATRVAWSHARHSTVCGYALQRRQSKTHNFNGAFSRLENWWAMREKEILHWASSCGAKIRRGVVSLNSGGSGQHGWRRKRDSA